MALDQSIHEASQTLILAITNSPAVDGNGLPMDAWVRAEKGVAVGAGWEHNNPLNTEYKMSCSFNANSAGVQGYYCQECGTMAILRTIENGDYPTLLEALKTANADLFFSAAGMAELDAWGTGGALVYSVYQSILAGEEVSTPGRFT